MKRIMLLSFVFCFSIVIGSAQELKPDTTKKSSTIPPPPPPNGYSDDGDDKIFIKVENEASFPGGNNAWKDFLVRKLGSYDAGRNGAPKGKYEVIVRFIVNKKGKISDIETLTNFGYGMEAIVIKMIKESPNWEPPTQNGYPVNAYRKQPVTFIVK